MNRKKTIFASVIFIVMSQLLAYISVILKVKRVLSDLSWVCIIYAICIGIVITYLVLSNSTEHIYLFMLPILMFDVLFVIIERHLTILLFNYWGDGVIFMFSQIFVNITLGALFVFRFLKILYNKFKSYAMNKKCNNSPPAARAGEGKENLSRGG